MPTIIQITDISVIPELVEIAKECFIDDPFYNKLSDNKADLSDKISKIFNESLSISLKYGIVVATISETNRVKPKARCIC